MDYLSYFVYGLIQGITEFIPISSTAHLKIVSLVFGINDPGSSLSAIIQLGSVFAILFYFRRDYQVLNSLRRVSIFRNIYSMRLLNSIILGTLSILICGLIIKVFFPYYSDSFLRSNLSIGFFSILMGFILLIADNSRKKIFSIKDHSYLSSFLIGIAQSFAIIPGVSRSGVTISAALLLGWKKDDAAKFSFLLGIPAITFSAFSELLDFNRNQILTSLGPLLVGLITAFIVSLLSIDFFLRFIRVNGLKIFSYYRFVFGSLILISYF